MFKNISILVVALCLAAHTQAQSPGNLNALNTTGHTGIGGATTYTYSVGEVVTFSNSCAYTPGVVQPTCVCMGIIPVIEIFDQKYSARFYPNPTYNQVLVETDYRDFVNYTISSLDGKIIGTGKFNYTPIDFGEFEPGTYILQLTSVQPQIFKTVKIIKQ